MTILAIRGANLKSLAVAAVIMFVLTNLRMAAEHAYTRIAPLILRGGWSYFNSEFMNVAAALLSSSSQTVFAIITVSIVDPVST